ncbi:MAG: T9SS type A sorting domain-containing protein [Bacteroidales bacterium]
MSKIIRKYLTRRSLLLLVLAFTVKLSLPAQVVIQRCDVTTGWQGAQTISTDLADKKEGKGSLKTEAQAGESIWFSKSFSSTQTGISSDDFLTFWLFISDASKLDGGEIEISSSGGQDDQEFHWLFSNDDVTDGWNEMQLQISTANQVGGEANLDSINFFRIHQTLSGSVTAKIDFIRFTPALEKPTWPVLDVPVVDNSTLDGKVMFGYQGWFNHPDDGAGIGWVHWGNFYEPLRSTVDMYPDMREYGANEKYNAHLTFPDGSMAPVYSSYNRNSVVRHMKWVRDYNLDGVFLQRFISGADDQKKMDHKDTVTKHIMEGCEKYGRVFAIMYDGVANRVEDMQQDWMHLVDDIGVTNSDRYLHHRGLPLVSLWGYSVRDEATPAQLAEMIDFFKNNPNPKYRASVKLGVFWNFYNRTEFQETFKQADVISPWFSGSTNYNLGQKWGDENNVDYIPVVHPGFSWYNLKYPEPSSTPNKDPRAGGQFIWDEVNDVIPVNSKSVYIAMFDEIDEGTAMFKLAENDDQIPREGYWLPLDEDGYDLPSDWYLRTASLATQVVRGYEALEQTLGTPPEGIMTIRITDVANDNNQGAMEFIFPDFPGETTIEISIDGGITYPYSTADDAGTYIISGLTEGVYPVVVRHGAASPSVDMGDVTISNLFEGLPDQANNPFPANGETGVRTNSVLGWTPGAHTVSHHIYFGTTPTPDSITYQFSNSFSPGDLEPETTYYWRIDEENGYGQTEGPLWSFTTGPLGGPSGIVVLDYCDDVTGWSSSNGTELDSENKQEGFASLSCAGGENNRFRKTFDLPVNTFCDESSYFNLWVYVSDVTAFNGSGQIEITSSGKPDTDEYSWSVPGLNLSNGWNELNLKISDASSIGNPDLSAINYFRFYQFVSKETVTKIDFLHFSELAFARIEVPKNLTATPGDQSVTLNWDDNTEADLKGYHLYRSLTSGSGYEKVNTTTITESTYYDGSLTNGTTYYYYVKAVNTADEESQASDEVVVIPGETTVDPGGKLQDFRLFPNPASSIYNIQFSIEESADVTVSVFDASGRQLHHFIENEHWMAGRHTLKLPLNGFAKGAYILQVKIDNATRTELLVIE